MPYRLIATDLDDTLLNASSEISSRNRSAIQKATEKGIRFLIATGRMFKTSVGYLGELGLDSDCPMINYHGALVKRSKSREVLLHRPLENDVAIAAAEEAAAQDCHVSVFIGDDLYIDRESEYSRYYQSLANIDARPVGNLVQFLKVNRACPTKMSIIRWDGTLDQIEADLRKSFGHRLSILQSRPYFLELTDRMATKGQTLRWFAEKEGIRAEEIIAFGDGHNDLDMLTYAGLGVAVANAREEVIAAADMVTASNIDDGVAEVIERLILEA